MNATEVKPGMRLVKVTVMEVVRACTELENERQNLWWVKEVYPNDVKHQQELFCFDLVGCERWFDLLEELKPMLINYREPTEKPVSS